MGKALNKLKKQSEIIKRHKELIKQEDFSFEKIPLKETTGGKDRFKHDIYLGKILSNTEVNPYYLCENDLAMHVILHGSTGIGKTTALKSLVSEIKDKYPNIPMLILTFKDDFNDLIYYHPTFQVIKPGENFSINIFNANDLDTEIYVENLKDIIESSQELIGKDDYSAQMEKIFVDILRMVVLDTQSQNWDAFEYYCNLYIAENKHKIPSVEQSVFAIQNRLRRLYSGGLKQIFGNSTSQHLSNLLNQDIILDLSTIWKKGGGKKDQEFFANMVFYSILAENAKRRSQNVIKHFLVVEEASYFGGNDAINHYRGSPPFVDLIKQCRGTGECIISATTEELVPSTMGNAGVFMAFKKTGTQDHIGKYLGLESEQAKMITHLKTGECIVKVTSYGSPFLIAIEEISLRKRDNVKV